MEQGSKTIVASEARILLFISAHARKLGWSIIELEMVDNQSVLVDNWREN